jgi:hypothetical protein
MKNLILISLAFGTAATISTSFAQTKKPRIQPGRMYEAGETIYAPRYGFTAKIPQGWEGSLPRESEIFLMHTIINDIYGEIFVFGREQSTLESLQQGWMKGVDLSENIKLKAVKPVIEGDLLSTEVLGEGTSINKGQRGFVAARCNPNGPCVVALTIVPKQFYDQVRSTLIRFMTESTFSVSSSASPYADLDWREYLSNKSLVTYAYMDGGSKDSEINLCGNGTFTATIKKSGFLKSQNPQYSGKLSGTWNTTSVGETATLKFVFTSKKDLPPLEVQVHFKDDNVYFNDERYFVGQSTRCK